MSFEKSFCPFCGTQLKPTESLCPYCKISAVEQRLPPKISDEVADIALLNEKKIKFGGWKLKRKIAKNEKLHHKSQKKQNVEILRRMYKEIEVIERKVIENYNHDDRSEWEAERCKKVEKYNLLLGSIKILFPELKHFKELMYW